MIEIGEKVSRREVLRIVGGATIGLAVGAGAGYLLGTTITPIERAVTQTTAKTTTATETRPTPTPSTVSQSSLKMGVITFISGAGAVSGVHVKNTAELIRDWINAEGGILGRKIEIATIVDESIGPAEVVKAARKMVVEDKVELILGVISSSTGLALAPVIEEELHVVTIYTSSTTTELFESVDPRPFYVFRTGIHAGMEAIAGARFVSRTLPNIKRVAGINPDYALGRDMWRLFLTALKKLRPDIEVVHEAWPPLGSADFTPHISALDMAKPDLIYTSLWGGDLVTFIKQAEPVGLFRKYQFVMSLYGSSYPDTDKTWTPEGLICGTRTYWPFYPPRWPLGERFFREYVSRFGKYPEFDAEQAFMGIYGYKLAIEKAYSVLGRYPAQEDIVKFLEGIYVPTPSGYRIFRREDHQGLGYAIYGITKHGPSYRFPILDPIYVLPPEEITPPPGLKTMDWINSW